MDMGKQSIQGFQNESASTVPQVTPPANEMNGVSLSSLLPRTEYEEMMAFLSEENDNCEQDEARKKSKTSVTTLEEEDSLAYLFQLDQPFSVEEILEQEETLASKAQVGGSSSSHVPRDVAEQSVMTNTGSSQRMNISISPEMIVSNACTSTFGESSSSGLLQQLGANMGAVNSIFSSDNCSNSSLSLPENNPKFWPAGSSALYPPQAATSFADSIFPKTTGNSFTQFESPSFPVHPYDCATGASATGVVGNQFLSPSLVNPYAGPGAGSGTGANNLDGNSLTPFQSPSLVHPYAGPSVGSGAVANNLDGNLLNQFQSPSLPLHSYVGPSAGPSRTPVVGTALTQQQSSSFPVHPYGSASGGGFACATASADASGFAGAANANADPDADANASHQQFTRDHGLEMNPLAAPSAMGANTWASPVPMRPQYNQIQFFSRQPFLRDFKDFELAWEGSLVEEVYPYRNLFNQAKAWKKSMSPINVTEWSSTLKVVLYVPRQAVINTMRIYGGPIDYIFFEATQFADLDLYSYLMSEKLYAKIALPSHTLILFTTESKHCFLGSVFKGDTVIVEHL
ncbi:hypothetical protein VNO80_23242 [Phaseolus coccineus]|uniref:Uncharacterized protein n=1 Tax=Phaseolus coccineus TaxID=3886 RepID=A0AAN9QZI5_PHACN